MGFVLVGGLFHHAASLGLPYFIISPPENICGTNWHLVGNSCLKITNAKENYDHAKLSCRSNGALLASLTTQKKVEFVLKELQKMQSLVSASLLCSLSNEALSVGKSLLCIVCCVENRHASKLKRT